jgi:hypothetical protein
MWFMSQKQKAALGSVVAGCTQLESTINLGIIIWSKLDQKLFNSLVRDLSFGNKLDLLEDTSATKFKSKKAKKRMESFVAEAKQINKLRNLSVHGEWSPPGGWKLSMLADGLPERPLEARSHTQKQVLKSETLHKLADRFEKANADLYDILREFWIKPVVRKEAQQEARKARAVSSFGVV